MAEEKIAGLLGKLPQFEGEARLPIKWAHEYFGTQAPPTYPIDVSQNITRWRMLGNGPDPNLTVNGGQPVGDCVVAATEHERMVAIVQGLLGDLPTADPTVNLYLQYTGGSDTGVVIADFLLWMYQKKRIAGFVPVHLAQVDATMAQFNRGVILGVELTNSNEAQFSNNQPWTASDQDPPSAANGHGVLKVKAHQDQSGVVVTWGYNHLCESSWFSMCPSEAWLILTYQDMEALPRPQWLSLVADLDALPNAHGPA